MNQGKESFGRPDTGPSVTLDPYCAAAPGNRTRAGCMNQGKEASLVQREVAANAAGGIGGVPPARCPGSHTVLAPGKRKKPPLWAAFSMHFARTAP